MDSKIGVMHVMILIRSCAACSFLDVFNGRRLSASGCAQTKFVVVVAVALPMFLLLCLFVMYLRLKRQGPWYEGQDNDCTSPQEIGAVQSLGDDASKLTDLATTSESTTTGDAHSDSICSSTEVTLAPPSHVILEEVV